MLYNANWVLPNLQKGINVLRFTQVLYYLEYYPNFKNPIPKYELPKWEFNRELQKNKKMLPNKKKWFGF